MVEQDLCDIWRSHHPNLKKYTWRSNPRKISNTKLGVESGKEIIHCRLDFFLTSKSLQPLIKNSSIKPGYHSDHSAVFLTIEPHKFKKGRGFWKLNTSYLQEKDYITKIERSIQTTILENPDTEPDLLWEIIKCNARRETISYSFYKKHTRDISLETIENEIDSLVKELALDPDDIIKESDLANSKIALDTLIERKTTGAALGSKTQYYELGERGTKYFHSLENINYNNKNIFKLRNHGGDLIENQDNILELEKGYYQSLYKSKLKPEKLQDNLQCWDEFYPKSDPPLGNSKLLEDMDNDLTESEIWDAINSSKINKSPGSDGLPVEFYKTFWYSIKTPLLNCYKHSFEKETLSITQRQGIITLIPKPEKDLLQISNWRAISLLNSDKILTKSLASRLKRILPQIINEDQSGFIPGRQLGENLLKIECIKKQLQVNQENGTLYALDFEKTFGSLEWATIQQALEHYGFGKIFRKWVKCLHNRPSSCVINSGFYS